MSDKKAFVIDVARCSGCYNCQLACKDEHCDNDWTPYAKPQPDIGQFWLKVEQHECGTIPKVRVHYIPRLCNHCEEAACIEVCPWDAIAKRQDGLVLIDPGKCGGCQDCVTACSYGAIYFNDDLFIAQKCTGCAHLLDNGNELPRCVEACPTDALKFGTEDELKELIAQAETPQPETGCGPNVYYLNVPKRFIAGTVYDPVDNEVVIGAICRLTSGGREWTVETDEYGDFWFEGLEEEKEYDLTIDSPGFAAKSFPALNPTEDINLGDVALTRKQ
jgi:Fe-S-cluster-containing dehydrogenase component